MRSPIRSDHLGALRERNFRLVFSAQAASVLGSQVAPIALAFAVYDLQASASALGLVLAARTVPNLVLLPIGGVLADRFPRQRLMIAASLGQAVSQGVTAWLLFVGEADVWSLAALQAVAGTAAASFLPASSALTPQAVSPTRLQQANALLSLTRSAAGVVGPALAGVLVAVGGSASALAFDAATFGMSAVILRRVRLHVDHTSSANTSFRSELLEGWRELRKRTWAGISIVGFMLFQLFFLAPFLVLGPLVAKESLGGPSAWAWIVAGYGIGAVAGDIAALRYEPSRPLVAGKLAMLLTLPSLLLLATSDEPFAIAVATALAGAALTFHDTLWFTALQENVPPGALSRVSAYDWMGSIALRPVGYALVGPAVVALGTDAVLVAGALLAGASQLAVLAVPSVRGVRRTDRSVEAAELPPSSQ